jgi:uncharacterized membrane protein
MRWPIARNRVSTPTSSIAPVQAAGAEVCLLPITRLEAFSDAVFAIAITLLVLELHVPAGNEALVRGLEHEWPRYLGYVVSFTFIGGVWIAHNYMTRFVKATDRGLIRLNLLLLLFVSFLPFTTAIAATHLFPSFLPFADHAVTRADLAAERAAVVIFGLNLILAALMLYVMIRHAGRTPGLAADDTAQLELRGFARERKTAVLLQASAAVVGLLLPVIAVIFYLAVSMIYLIEPFREVDIHAPRAIPPGKP